jgi:mono/diheme cytochrome c family protein
MKKFQGWVLFPCALLALIFSYLPAQDQPGSEGRAAGRKLFLRNCASCHGMDAKGRGIVAASLKKQPPDLTRIPRQDGRFPAEKLVLTITGELALPIHGEREMPVWGNVLNSQEVETLVGYLESIQNPIATRDR